MTSSQQHHPIFSDHPRDTPPKFRDRLFSAAEQWKAGELTSWELMAVFDEIIAKMDREG